jgi:hypothetical protein
MSATLNRIIGLRDSCLCFNAAAERDSARSAIPLIVVRVSTIQ